MTASEGNIELQELLKTISEYQSKIQALEKKLDKFEAASQWASDGLWDIDLITNTPFISAPWKKMLGYEADELIELKGLWEKLLHPEDKKEIIEKFDNFIEGKSNTYNELFRLKHKNGSYKWIRSRAKNIKDENGEVIRVSGSHTDVTEIIEAESAIRKSEEKYKLLFQNSLVGMFRTDVSTGKIIEANDKAWEILGEKNKKNKGTFNYYKDPEDRNIVLNAIQNSGKGENLELQIRKASGELIWVLFSVFLQKKENILETIIVDITEQKSVLIELQKVNFELDNFVYHASHDLRSPLSSILGLVNIYKKETNPSVQADCIDRIESSVKRLDALVGDLLSISRNNRINDPLKEFNFLVEINNSINNYFVGLETKNLDIRVIVKQPLPFVSDLTRVRVILNNLISNAIKYRDLKKNLSIITINVVVDDNSAIFTIEDNGQGIEKNKIGSIFDMFVRANENSQGSGLGLYIVKNAIDKLKGTIKLETNTDVGSTFTVTIPNSHSLT